MQLRFRWLTCFAVACAFAGCAAAPALVVRSYAGEWQTEPAIEGADFDLAASAALAEEQGDFALAAKLLADLSRRHPQAASLRMELSRVLCKQRGHAGCEAEPALVSASDPVSARAAAERHPERAELWLRAAALAQAAGDTRGAAAAFLELATLHPNRAGALEVLLPALVAQGDVRGAEALALRLARSARMHGTRPMRLAPLTRRLAWDGALHAAAAGQQADPAAVQMPLTSAAARAYALGQEARGCELTRLASQLRDESGELDLMRALCDLPAVPGQRLPHGRVPFLAGALLTLRLAPLAPRAARELAEQLEVPLEHDDLELGLAAELVVWELLVRAPRDALVEACMRVPHIHASCIELPTQFVGVSARHLRLLGAAGMVVTPASCAVAAADRPTAAACANRGYAVADDLYAFSMLVRGARALRPAATAIDQTTYCSAVRAPREHARCAQLSKLP